MTEQKMDKAAPESEQNVPESEQNVPEEPEKSAEVLVDDLADAGDYWLSITDAARVTRRQEITIRRWIAAGTLPVRRQRMGPNKRTRHVRASDLGALTPIIDPLAAITGAPANADLMSIPHQQAQLALAQQEYDQRLALIHDHLLELERDLHEQATRHQHEVGQLRQEQQAATRSMTEQVQQSDARCNEMMRQQQQALEALRQTTQEALREQDAALAEHQKTLLAQIDLLQENADQQQMRLRDEFTDRLSHSEELVQQQLQSLREHITAFQQQSVQTAHSLQHQIEQGIQSLQEALAAADQQQQRQQVLIRQRFQEIERRRRRTSRSRISGASKSSPH